MADLPSGGIIKKDYTHSIILGDQKAVDEANRVSRELGSSVVWRIGDNCYYRKILTAATAKGINSNEYYYG